MDAPPALAPYDPPREPLRILHDDHEIVVLDKPAGLLSVPGKGEHLADCLLARVRGEMAEREGVVDLPIRVDWPNRPRQIVAPDGRPAVTRWKRLRAGQGETRVRLFPETGRSHQLRVHMLAIGHPILGDPFYAEGAAREFPRLMLHSESLSIRHPDGGKTLRFASPAPF